MYKYLILISKYLKDNIISLRFFFAKPIYFFVNNEYRENNTMFLGPDLTMVIASACRMSSYILFYIYSIECTVVLKSIVSSSEIFHSFDTVVGIQIMFFVVHQPLSDITFVSRIDLGSNWFFK